jgi:methyl-accepting chemotaxis protein
MSAEPGRPQRAALHELYRVNEDNLALRRGFIRLGERENATLARLARWADGAADAIAADLTRHHFEYPATRAFLTGYVDGKGMPLDALRDGWQAAQAAHFRQIFEQGRASKPFGTAYFEQLLAVGKLHNVIDLPLKWYIGSYPFYLDAVRRHLRRRYPHRPLLRARASRAVERAFNFDMQAIVDAFYYDTFAMMGVDVSRIEVDRVDHDLSDRGHALKATVRAALEPLAGVVARLRASAEQMARTSEEAGRAVAEIANAVGDVAQGAERQVRVVAQAKSSTDETVEVAGETRAVAEEGVDAAQQATGAMQAVRDSSAAVSSVMSGLAAKSERIGGIVATITGIAGQTNLLALNAAIEAARAGEQGRGFAVVADEVRKLAEESQGAAATIAELIGEIQSEIGNAVAAVEDGASRSQAGVEIVEQTRAAFERIGGAVGDVTARVSAISEAIGEVAAVAEQSSASTQQVSASSEETTASTQEVAASARELAQIAEDLDRLVATFDFGG